MKVLLCSTPSNPAAWLKENKNHNSMGELPVVPKMAIVSLMRWMFANGFQQSDCEFLDIDMLVPDDDEIFNYFISIEPDVIGLSAVTSGAYSNVKQISSIARRACPSAIIVLGGNLAASANVVLRKTEVDVCVVGDGEIAWVKLLNHFKESGLSIDGDALKNILGLAFLQEHGELIFTGYGEKLPEDLINLNPDYEILKSGLRGQDQLLNNYFREGRGCSWFMHDPRTHSPLRKPNIADLQISKGCVAKCTFCQRATKGYRRDPIQHIEDHISYLVNNHDVGFIHLIDENFGSDVEHSMAFAKIMKKYDVLWAATGVRCDSVTRDIIKNYAENNCVALKFGVESGSQKILNIMEKKFTKEQVKKAVYWCSEFNIFSPLAIMFGMPGETFDTAIETGRFIAEIELETNREPNEDYDVFYAIPFPGTPLYEYGQQIGIIGTSVEAEEEFLMDLFTSQSYKLAYINLNGAPLREVIFWDVLALMEAMRHYVRNKSKSLNGPVANADHEIDLVPKKVSMQYQNKKFFSSSIIEIIKRRIKTGHWRHSTGNNTYISRILKLKVVRSYWAARMPRFIIYPLVQSLLIFEYYLIKFLTKKGNTADYKYLTTHRNVQRISNRYQEAFPERKLVSIRNIVTMNRSSPSEITEKSRIQLLAGM